MYLNGKDCDNMIYIIDSSLLKQLRFSHFLFLYRYQNDLRLFQLYFSNVAKTASYHVKRMVF